MIVRKGDVFLYKITASAKAILNSMQGFIGCKDSNLNYVYVNQAFIDVIGLIKCDDILGKNDFDIPAETSLFAELFQERDKRIMCTGNIIKSLEINPRSKEIYLVTKSPLLNKNNRSIGVILQGVSIINRPIFEMTDSLLQLSADDGINCPMQQTSSLLSTPINIVNLSKRQSEVLFYSLLGKTVKQIAKFLTLSPRTIDEHLEQLRIKFKVENKHKLIEKAILEGYLNNIPGHLLHSRLSVELHN
jgi:DNA-binding CsgD family transcriptional regulator